VGATPAGAEHNLAALNLAPHKPWQRGTNENTNGLLRQYFPKGSDLAIHAEAGLDAVAAELNDRPRKRLGYRKPIEEIGHLRAARPHTPP